VLQQALLGGCWKQIFVLGIEELACAILIAVAKVFYFEIGFLHFLF
jgi:hypothetical protein